MKDVALITGASRGIGFELALLFAQQRIDVVIVAHDSQKLLDARKAIASNSSVKVHAVAADLSTIEGTDVVRNYIDENNLRVKYLVNNAGFGDYGPFIERNMETYSRMIRLNIEGLTALTYTYARDMVRNGNGRILNVASTAGYQPDPHFAVYGATKAYVVNFTEALHKELSDTGVTATVLSPGATRTDFISRADMLNAKLYDSGVMSAKDVALAGFRAMMSGKLYVIPGFKNRFMTFLSGVTPSRRLLLEVSARIMSQRTT
ncbi:MAG TPA: short-chain dehydrogenase [Bacteroidetes bacterium]|jgi:short-subunit dehydrogenase|nr:short-chain dehydrogenase [Bacteroidota bacterium]